ncbi:MAG: asparagine synthase (glutamine-hydrolyzing) [Mesorhizobium sp.]|uniref:asparagine synthase (glutamine-hydrolyzing) n=4 Tax=unclassified Mesorhizobium TaxID=325217 RepID=UPI000FE38207|nr:asparagine synthase (glutamine-hydrolyzing) [Mesorhizobium sp.]RWI41165.1 MAG: asparagine synthase (glutamine-hydrolyzing) [Mesorhizobium sp.]RWI46762.1 MAG: asparagine synthase (glutamine-hydrolyzing) [Mesorhizobium sp.]RWI56280.1 MAG: asparagine synthase (glutamine-hydrolyzing) [Mesorhizobium sp.]RWI69433.1 MAG: asparagine synthase (glutamine-hydrolyzing) [Mesorhizobium sp.]RWI88512.1 MAG: asparagine synthase (glutamine-hydrolyzing) [Mesorhizobium sp.]
MCGVAGILLAPDAARAKPLRAIAQMTTALRHRGPDGDGFWTDRKAGVAFGHRRLAIVDLSEAGHQPMHSATGRYTITFNGEIYNFQDLRRELEDAGHRFRGTCDTEVMLCAIESWGLDTALTRFAGMFAFGLWDMKTRTLHLARDRMGKKPLYVASTRDALVFASELKAINGFPGFRQELDIDAATSMLSRGWVPDNKCIWRGVFKLPPGSVLSVTAADFAEARSVASLSHRIRYWWSLAEVAAKGRQEPIVGTDEELTDQLDGLLRLAVRERMNVDVPLGGFLSGGVDSSVVVALMQAQSTKPVRTFTVAFGEGGFDEAPHAAEVARHLGTDHTELHLSCATAREVIPELPQIWDEPFADESQIPTLLVARLARQHVTVALTGDGGDECFAGYARHLMAARARRQHRLPSPLRQALAAGVGLLARAARHDRVSKLPLSAHARHALRSDRLDRLARLLAAADEDELYHRLRGSSTENLTQHELPLSVHGAPPLDGLLSRLLYDDMVGYLPGDILVKLDRASMAASLEGRCPLLDHRVVDFAWRLPADVMVRHGRGKWILRQLLHRYVPKRLTDRPKQGFDVPIAVWLRGPLRIWANDLLADMRLSGDGIFDFAKVQTCWRDHIDGRQDHSRDLWAALMFQTWRNEAHRPPAPAADRYPALELAGV